MSKYDKLLVPPNSPILKQVCRAVDPSKDYSYITRIMEKVCKKGSVLGVGLAAPQLGYDLRIIYLNCPDEKGTIRGTFMFNPVITYKSASTTIDLEACLSYPGKSKYISRSSLINVTYFTEKGLKKNIEASGYYARVIQHEVEHLFGVCKVGDDSYLDDLPF